MGAREGDGAFPLAALSFLRSNGGVPVGARLWRIYMAFRGAVRCVAHRRGPVLAQGDAAGGELLPWSGADSDNTSSFMKLTREPQRIKKSFPFFHPGPPFVHMPQKARTAALLSCIK